MNNTMAKQINQNSDGISRIELHQNQSLNANQSKAPSISSHNISIETLPDNCDSSSASETDSDFDEDFVRNSNFIIKSTTSPNQDGTIFLEQNVLHPGPKIGSICVRDATDITFGNKTLYEGPVTIKQVTVKSDVKDNPSENKFKTFIRNNQLLSISILILLILVVIVSIFVLLSDSLKNIPKTSGTSPSSIKNTNWNYPPTKFTTSNGLEIMQRDDWNADIPETIPEPLKHPLNRVLIYHTGNNANCTQKYECIQILKNMQENDFQIGYGDIGFSFLLGGDGRVYVGRGWDFVGAHTPGQNYQSIGIAFIGNFIIKSPEAGQFEALKLLLEDGVKLNKLTNDYAIFPKKCFIQSVSPGHGVLNEIQNWDHYFQKMLVFNDICMYPT